MFAIPGIVLLVGIIYARPQEFISSLDAVPILYLLFGLALYGGVLDWRMGNTRFERTPLLPWVLLFVVWSFFTVAMRVPTAAPPQSRELLICAALYLLIAHGVQTFRGLAAVSGMVLAMVLLVTAVGAQQGFADKGCVLIDEYVAGDATTGRPDGRPCNAVPECYLGDPEPGGQYMCEHVGWFGTTSVGNGRVRYRGVLQDPNELALAGGIGLPLAFALGRRSRASQRSVRWLVVIAVSFALILACTILTRSRGGQLVFSAVLGAYFVKRFGLRGILFGGLLALPLLLLGGRSGNEAASSTIERIDCWDEALSMWRAHPILGVGLGEFGKYHYMTAHNSYLLALAELGFPGMMLFSILVYMSAKIPLHALRHGTAAARPWAMALLASFAGLTIGMFFLSFAYHYILWIYVGLAGALFAAVRTHDPTFRVSFGWRDLAIVACANCAVIVLVYAYVRRSLGS